jgi:hypothetical protein
MTVLQARSQNGGRPAEKRWYRFGHGTEAVRHTEAWEHENFEEEQARWERSDLRYARICDAVRQARRQGGAALRRAEDAKAAWDARVGTRRQANDDAETARHVTQAKSLDKE